MADFYQTGIIITLHKLGKPSLERTEAELVEFSKHRPIALVLPALYAEFQAPALQGIIDELKKVKYVNEIVLTLGRATDEEFKKAKEFMAQIPYKVKIIHNEGKRIKEIYATFERNGLSPGEDGKGREAARVFMENPMGTPLIPNWNRVTSAIPGILDMLKKAVDEDNK